MEEETQKSLKEIWENTGQQVEVLKEAVQKSHRELQNMGQHAETHKEESQISLRESQENMDQQVEALKEVTQKFLKEFQEKTNKQVKELNKTIQDLNLEIESTKKSQSETSLKIENLGKNSGVIDPSINNRIEEIE